MCCEQAELEDLSFAVLHPSKYCSVRMQLDNCWQLPTVFQPPLMFQPQNANKNEQQSLLPESPAESAEESGDEAAGLQQQKRQAAVQTLNEVLYSFEQLNASR